YSGERLSGGVTLEAISLSRSCTEGVSRVTPIAALSLRTIGSGVPLGKKKPNQVSAWKSTPCSSALGKFGNSGERSRPRSAIAFPRLPSITGLGVGLSVQM